MEVNTMKKHIFPVVLLMLTLLPVSFAGAQPPGPPDGPPGRPGPGGQDRIRERIKTMRMWKLTQALDLDQGTSAKLFPILNKYDEQRRGTEQELRNDMRKLRTMVDSGDESGLSGLLRKLEKNHRTMQEIKDAEWNELKGVLTVKQQAKFLIFQLEFERDMRRMISEARERRQDGDFERGNDRPFRPGR